MISRRRLFVLGLTALLVLAGIAAAQRGWRERRGDRDRGRYDYGDMSADDFRPHRGGVPDWEVPAHMADDVFTFVRIRYNTQGWGGGWATDWPSSDLNFSYRLQELTSMEVNPNGKILELTDPRLFDYPFIYMIEPGGMWLRDEEIAALRKYLENGGFLMVDDFWGDHEWRGFIQDFSKVFPEKELQDLTIDHPIFHCVFDLPEMPQVPSMPDAIRGRDEGITWEWRKPGSKDVQYKAIFNDDGRMMCIVCFNTDLGDGWEREGEDEWYFKEFSEKKSYPMGINIVFYALTH
jgi:hypothetical protein